MDRYKPDFSTPSIMISIIFVILSVTGIINTTICDIAILATLILGFSMVKVKEERKSVVKSYSEEAIVRICSVDSCNYISVGFEDSDKVIGLFGYEGDNDEEESYANAKIFADAINGV